MKEDECFPCWENGLFCEGCDDEDKEYIRESLEKILDRKIADSELCKLCIEHEIYKEVICVRCEEIKRFKEFTRMRYY